MERWIVVCIYGGLCSKYKIFQVKQICKSWENKSALAPCDVHFKTFPFRYSGDTDNGMIRNREDWGDVNGFFRLFFTIVHVDPSFVHPRLKSQMTDKHSLHFTTLFKMFAILDVQRLPIYELSFCFKSKSEANWQSLGIFWACASERRWMKVNVQSRTKWTLYTLRPNIDNVHTLTSFYTLCPEMVARSNNTVCFRATSLQSIPSVLKPMIKQAKIIQIRIIET